jgi:ABC-type nitrate/sulfonate/bicarbonate transport system substrate-binding protein
VTRLSLRLASGAGPTFGVDDLACAAATHLGCWADEGLDVSWTPVHGGVAAIQAVLDGRVDASYGGLGPVLRSRAEGHPVRIIVSMARALAQNLVAQEHIRDVAQLRGASWALDGIGALSHHMARLIVQALDIPEREIDWQVVGPPPERIARLLAGTVDVSLIRIEEAISLDLDPGNRLHILQGFSELKRLVPVQPHGVLATTQRFAQDNPEAILRLVTGMTRASRALNDDFDAFRTVFAHYVTVPVPPDHVRRIWQQERESHGFAVNGELTEAHWRQQMTLFAGLNPQLPRVDRDDVILDRYLREALKTLGVRAGADALS